MNNMRKIASLLLALVMVFALATTAFAQDVIYAGADKGTGTITISNASKSETYKVYKLFDATVGTAAINYTGTIPQALAEYFEKDDAGNITATEAAKSGDNMSDGLKNALKTWTGTATALSEVTSDGSKLCFKELPFGYYVVTTTQGQQVISVNSTKPDANIVDKNTTQPTLTKTVDGANYSVGDTITYTLTFKTANYKGTEKISEYVIEDTLPEFLSDVTVTSITIGGADYKVGGSVPQFTEKKITFPWVDEQGNHKYANGAEVVIVYTAKLTEKAAFGTANTNTATLTYSNETLTDTADVYSYTFDVVKTKNDNTLLTGAKFKLYDAQTGGNEIKLKKETDGSYVVDANGSDVIEAGKATIKGLKNGTYWLEETEAPAGYNKLKERKSVTITDANNSATMNETTYVSGGIQVINQAGTELPSTGGMGTTIFYVVGSILVLAAGVLLVTKKRMSAEN